MMSILRYLSVLVGALLVPFGAKTEAAQQPRSAPLLQDGPELWEHDFGVVFPPVPGSAPPTWQDPSRPFVRGRTWHIPDLSNPNIKQWAKDVMKKAVEELDRGKLQFNASASCLPTGVPNFLQDGGPYLIVQAPDKVVMIDEAGPVVRHIYLNVPHSKNPKPSWMGESVGRYEGDALVVDTIGMNDKTLLDRFGTPHSDKVHVIERWRLVENRRSLRVDVTVEDPDTFYRPWMTYQVYQRGERPLEVEVCPENNLQFDFHMPVAQKPDF